MANWPYTTRRWQRLRRAKLRRDPLCEYCAPRLTAAAEVDHRQAIASGGDPWAWENLASTCKPCHSRKTRYEDQLHRPQPVKGCDAHGLPLDPHHPWARKKLLGADGEERPAAMPET